MHASEQRDYRQRNKVCRRCGGNSANLLADGATNAVMEADGRPAHAT